jgi:hypothetical protein
MINFDIYNAYKIKLKKNGQIMQNIYYSYIYDTI